MEKSKNKNKNLGYPKDIIRLLNNTNLFGKISNPTCSSYLKGPCGDSMEFYLIIKNNKITNVKYYTDACGAARACAAMVAQLAYGKSIDRALAISAGEVIKQLKSIPKNHQHCSILSVSTLYRAIANYLLKT